MLLLRAAAQHIFNSIPGVLGGVPARLYAAPHTKSHNWKLTAHRQMFWTRSCVAKHAHARVLARAACRCGGGVIASQRVRTQRAHANVRFGGVGATSSSFNQHLTIRTSSDIVRSSGGGGGGNGLLSCRKPQPCAEMQTKQL